MSNNRSPVIANTDTIMTTSPPFRQAADIVDVVSGATDVVREVTCLSMEPPPSRAVSGAPRGG